LPLLTATPSCQWISRVQSIIQNKKRSDDYNGCEVDRHIPIFLCQYCHGVPGREEERKREREREGEGEGGEAGK
jgi:hypothetical protein